MTKEEIFSRDYYEIQVYSLKQGRLVTIVMDSQGIWDLYKSYSKLGSVKCEFPNFWDYVQALASYNV